MYSNHELQPFNIEVYSFPTHEVRAMGLKLLGMLGSVSAATLPRRRSTPTFHCDGTDKVDQQVLKRWSRPDTRDGQFLNTINQSITRTDTSPILEVIPKPIGYKSNASMTSR